ncbi:unnamed protein product, partial [Discosporangium mesarthrocarpum]
LVIADGDAACQRKEVAAREGYPEGAAMNQGSSSVCSSQQVWNGETHPRHKNEGQGLRRPKPVTGGGHSLIRSRASHKQGTWESTSLATKFHFKLENTRRQHLSQESWIPMDLRMK